MLCLLKPFLDHFFSSFFTTGINNPTEQNPEPRLQGFTPDHFVAVHSRSLKQLSSASCSLPGTECLTAALAHQCCWVRWKMTRFSQHAWCINRGPHGLKISKYLPKCVTSSEWQVLDQNSTSFSITRPSLWSTLLDIFCFTHSVSHTTMNWVSLTECFHHITCQNYHLSIPLSPLHLLKYNPLLRSFIFSLKAKAWRHHCRAIVGASQVVLGVKNPPANAGDMRDAGSIPGSGRFPGRGHGNPLQCSCLEKPMDRGALWSTVHSVAKSDTTEVT